MVLCVNHFSWFMLSKGKAVTSGSTIVQLTQSSDFLAPYSSPLFVLFLCLGKCTTLLWLHLWKSCQLNSFPLLKANLRTPKQCSLPFLWEYFDHTHLWHCIIVSYLPIFLLTARVIKVLVTQSCVTLQDPMDCSPPGSCVLGIFQARILEWVAISFSRGILPTQGSNSGLLHCRQILYQLSHQGRDCGKKKAPILGTNKIKLMWHSSQQVLLVTDDSAGDLPGLWITDRQHRKAMCI